MKKLILSDCDGCICNWNSGFEQYMSELGFPKIPNTDHEYSIQSRYDVSSNIANKFVTEFNESENIASLQPFADSLKYIDKLAYMGFRFVIITSLSDNPLAKIHRTKNLTKLFGNVFDDIICIKMGSNKLSELMKWKDSGYFWIEDHIQQSEAGYKAGLSPILINHEYNESYTPDYPKVSAEQPWKEVYERILDRYY